MIKAPEIEEMGIKASRESGIRRGEGVKVQ